MRTLNLGVIIALGANIASMQRIMGNFINSGLESDYFNSLLKYLHYCINNIYTLEQNGINFPDLTIYKVVDELTGFGTPKSFSDLDESQQKFMRKLNRRLVIEVFEEIGNFLTDKDAHLLHQDFNLNYSKLKKSPSSFMNSYSWNHLSQIEKEDLQDATNAILFELWTPAGMILLRIGESLLRSYYKKITGEESTDVWGIILQKLESNKDKDKSLFLFLSYLKNIRNELQHPDKRLNQNEAEQFFHQILYLIEKVHTENE